MSPRQYKFAELSAQHDDLIKLGNTRLDTFKKDTAYPVILPLYRFFYANQAYAKRQQLLSQIKNILSNKIQQILSQRQHSLGDNISEISSIEDLSKEENIAMYLWHQRWHQIIELVNLMNYKEKGTEDENKRFSWQLNFHNKILEDVLSFIEGKITPNQFLSLIPQDLKNSNEAHRYKKDKYTYSALLVLSTIAAASINSQIMIYGISLAAAGITIISGGVALGAIFGIIALAMAIKLILSCVNEFYHNRADIYQSCAKIGEVDSQISHFQEIFQNLIAIENLNDNDEIIDNRFEDPACTIS